MGHCLTPWNPYGVEEILSVNQIIMRGTVLRCIMSRIVKEVNIRSFLRLFAVHFSEKKLRSNCSPILCALFLSTLECALISFSCAPFQHCCALFSIQFYLRSIFTVTFISLFFALQFHLRSFFTKSAIPFFATLIHFQFPYKL